MEPQLQKYTDSDSSDDEYYGTQLHYACNSGDYQTVYSLIKNYTDNVEHKIKEDFYVIDLNEKDSNGKTAFEITLDKQHFKIVKEFSKCEYIKTEDIDIDKYLVMYSSFKHDVNIFDILFKSLSKNSINKKYKNDNTLLHFACEYGNVEMVNNILLYKGIDISKKNVLKNTPLHIACEKGHFECVDSLLEHIQNESEINCVNKNNETPLYLAVKYDHFDVVSSMLENDFINVNEMDYYPKKKSILHIACENCNDEIVKLLLSEDDIDVNMINIKGRTPLHIAFDKGDISTIKLLLSDKNVNINVIDEDGITPINYITYNLDNKILDLIINNVKDCEEIVSLLATRKSNKLLINDISSHYIQMKNIINQMK